MSNAPELLKSQMRYDGASKSRRMAGWVAPQTGPISSSAPALPTLRNRARDLVRNDALAASFVRTMTSSLIGFGVTCRPKTKDVDQKARINTAWTRWTKNCVKNGGDFASLQALVVRAMTTDGEVFILMNQRPVNKFDKPDAVRLELQVLEADLVPQLDTENYPGLAKGHKIVQGVEFDTNGYIVGYWLHKTHPGESFNAFATPTELIRVSAENMLHVFEPQRPGAVRGVPQLAPVMARLRNVGDFDDAQLERQRLANLFVAFVGHPVASGASDVMTGLPYQGTADAPLAGLEPGTVQELLSGETVTFSTPPDAGSNYSEFIRTQYLSIAAGLGVPEAMLYGEIRDISDRTLRFTINEFRRRVDQIFWCELVPRFFQPIRREFAMRAALAGAITADDFDEAVDSVFAQHAQADIHHLQDVNARIKEVDAGLRSRASVIAERGDDPDQVDAERKEDLDRANDLGVTPLDDQKLEMEIAQQQYNITTGSETAAKAQAAMTAIADESRQGIEILNAIYRHDPRAADIYQAKSGDEIIEVISEQKPQLASELNKLVKGLR